MWEDTEAEEVAHGVIEWRKGPFSDASEHLCSIRRITADNRSSVLGRAASIQSRSVSFSTWTCSRIYGIVLL